MIGIIIQARMESKRLPGKVLMPLENQPVLSRVLAQLKNITGVDRAIIATTELASDDPIVSYCKQNHVDYYRGSTEDVLERYYACARKFSLKTIIRVTADCPLIDPAILWKTVQIHLEMDADYTSNRLTPRFPQGLDVDVLKFSALEKVFKTAAEPLEREHVVIHIWKNRSRFSVQELVSKEDYSKYRWVLDWPEDYTFLSKIFGYLRDAAQPLFMQQVLDVLQKHPEWLAIHEKLPRVAYYDHKKE